MRVNGQSGVELSISPLQEANPIEVAELVKQKLQELKKNLPEGMQATINLDASTYLKMSIQETFFTIGEAVVLVTLIVFLFLGSLRAASIPIITIPVSLLAVFVVIKLMGFTINIMSLLAMVLAIGLVVDDAIVMLENIHRYIEKGLSPFKAALKGSKEISSAVVAMGLTLAAVYAPLGFSSGFTAELFREFAFTLAGAVIISAFVALTLSPMMSAKVLLPRSSEGGYMTFLEGFFKRLSEGYQKILTACMQKRHIAIILLFILGGIGYGIFKILPSELIPQEDTGVVKVGIRSPAGASIDYTNHYAQQAETIIKSNPAISGMVTQVGWNAMIQATLKPWGERKQSTTEVVNALNRQFSNIPGADISAFIPDIVDYGGMGAGSDIELNLMTTGDYRDLVDPVNRLVKLLKNYPGLINVQTNLKFDNQQYAMTIDRDLAAVLGVNIQDLADTVQAMMSGNHWTNVQSGGRSYPVLVQMQKKDLANFDALNKLYVRGTKSNNNQTAQDKTMAEKNNHMVPVSSLVKLTPIVGQGSLAHFNRFRAGKVSASLAPGYSESQAIAYIKKVLPSVLKPNVQYSFSGKAREFIESSGGIFMMVMMSIVFIYLVLSAQFGSFIDPFIVLFAVPLCIVGALIFLFLTGNSISIYSEIGFVTLIGMISKHGILITQFINNLRREGVDFTHSSN